ncbi:uncharacterized protein EDB93DRAFT_1252558 [Suillus bovinus]|uniref:uncharacterized protein n=1 Tax=Suillus bovinus TaxID=48563 RepID=UPI001B881AB7|nr:uncharacterized protein EDB93DRAFT_1252558 [Suillus bovinus]KAG2141413.1 hypothetical protein EDB93DRAFT_1252558 [Suillus bovinus]
MARDFLAIQGSATPSERALSSGSITDQSRHNRLTPDIFEALQLLKSAYHNRHIQAAAEAAARIEPLAHSQPHDDRNDSINLGYGGQEVELVWRQRWSLVTVLYLIARYVTIGFIVYVSAFWAIGVALITHPSQSELTSWDIYSLPVDTQIYIGLAQIFEIAQLSVLGPRLILIVREYNAKLVADSDTTSVMTSIVFQEHVHVETSNSV